MIASKLKDRNKLYLVMGLFFIVVLLFRWGWVRYVAVNVPYFDQWDGDVDALYLKYKMGILGFSDFFIPANEHRIVYTRIINLFNFLLHGEQADSMGSIYFQHILQAISATLLVFVLNRNKVDIFRTVIIGIFFAVPVTVENFYWAYQSQVYIMILLTLISFWIFSKPDFSVWQVLAMSLIASINMANSMWIPFFAAVVSAYYFLKLREKKYLGYILLFLIVTAVIYKCIPFNPAHKVLQVTNLKEFGEGVFKYLSWPLGWGWFLIWLPLAFSVIYVLLKKEVVNRDYIFAVLIMSWVLILLLAASYGRKGEIPNRYYDYMTFGLIGAVMLTSQLDKFKFKFVPVGVVLAIAIVHICKPMLKDKCEESVAWKTHGEKMRKIVQCAVAAESANTGGAWEYLKDKEPMTYPSNERLAYIISKPVVREMLTVIGTCPAE